MQTSCNVYRPDRNSTLTGSSMWEIRVVVFLGLLLAWRILYIWMVPLELSPDEAYYWEWSRRLDWGYYSKPPMVAWIMALSTTLLGNTAFAVRLPAAILGTLSLWCSYALARAMFSARTGWWTAVLVAASPGACIAGLIMTIDAPLLFFWTLALLCLWNALQYQYLENNRGNRQESVWWWLATGLAAGAGMLTKQTMFAFWPMVMAFMCAGRDTRPFLKSWLPWSAIALSLALLVPVAWWNMQHGWITLQHTAHHFAQVDRNLLDSLATFFEFIGSQLGIISPVTCILVFMVSGVALMRIRTFVLRPGEKSGNIPVERAGGLLLFTGIAVLIPIALLSLKQRINANWPAPFYFSPVILVAAWHEDFFSFGPSFDNMRGLVVPGAVLGAFLSLLLYALPFIIPAAGLDGTDIDPTVRTRGWRELAQQVDTLRDNSPAPERTFIITRLRQTASELAFYMRDNPRPYRWSGNRKNITTQYELWPAPNDRKGWDALVIIDIDKQVPADLPHCFDNFRELPPVKIPMGNGNAKRYRIYLGTAFHACN